MSYSTEKNMMLYLTGQQTEAEVTVEELDAITQQYPYFGAAKFLLAKKALAENNPGFESLAQSAVVHFANPYWFHFKLNEEQLMIRESVLTDEIEPGETAAEKPMLTVDAALLAVADVTNIMVNRQEANEVAQLKEDIAKDVIVTAGNNTVPIEEEAVTSGTDSTYSNKPGEDALVEAGYRQLEEDVTKELENEEGLEEKVLAAENESTNETDEVVPAVSLEDVPLDKDDVIPAVSPEDAPLDKDDIVPATEVNSYDVTYEDDIVPSIEAGKVTDESDDLIPAIEQVEEMPATVDENVAIAEDEHPEGPSPHIPGTGEDIDAETGDDGEFTDGDEEDDALIDLGPVSDKISSVLQDQLEEFKKPVAAGTQVPIETEPYHTVDYFASQGIKLSLDQQKQDNLGVKVRKFTDWLKQMKRVSPTPADLGIDEAAEHKVQSIAATSNEVKEVVTEAMAEVLAMQGMNAKAIQVYKKLSFLEPTKSAYFAAKIETLKG